MTGFRIKPEGRAMGRKVKRPRVKADKHLAWIRTLPSVISGCMGCEACHIRMADLSYAKQSTGMQEKPDDRWTLPMTPDEHRKQHSGSERGFWLRQDIDPCKVALALWCVSGDDEAALMILKFKHGGGQAEF